MPPDLWSRKSGYGIDRASIAMRNSFWGSWLALRLGVGASCALLLLLLADLTVTSRDKRGGTGDSFAEQTFRHWCSTHRERANLQVVDLNVHFPATPENATRVDGALITPIAIDLDGAQRVVEVASQPTALRTLSVQGITSLAWEYPGRINRERTFRALALVERPPATVVTPPATPSFAKLPDALKQAALGRAKDLGEHGLDECVDFAGWAQRSAGSGSYPTRIRNLIATVSERTEKEEGSDDLCTTIREGKFTAHQAQVAVVMAARELEIPAFGLTTATVRKAHLVGTYVDDVGWITIDVDDSPSDGWSSGGPPLLTLAPIVGRFAASSHNFWTPLAQVYVDIQNGEAYPVSSTKWRDDQSDRSHATTGAVAKPFDEVCG